MPASTALAPWGVEAKSDLTNQLLDRIKALIGEGALAPGAKLPPERQLAESFGVSRSSLRHAIKALEVMGVLRQRVGDGTYLTEDSAHILKEPLQLLFLMDEISFEDLLETRLIVEPELAARAAERATKDDISVMEASLKAMQKRGASHEELIDADLAFHRAIFEAARNPLCKRIFSLVHSSMVASIGLTSQMVDWKHTLSFHRPIFTAIERRRPEEARQRMIDHLNDARRLLAEVRKDTPKRGIASIIQPIPPMGRHRPRRANPPAQS
jgi:GntR family transcriptional repressor for pyruvate dehydrogenase complex